MGFLWTDGTTHTPGEPLREDVHTEVCVIGGGTAGVLCAAQLTARGIDNVLLEARQIGEGITKGTTAVLTGQDHLREEAELLHELGFDAVYTTGPQLPLPVADAVIYPDMAQFHPLRFLNTAAKGLRIYDHTFVTALDGTTAVTAHGRVHAKKVIVATHFPFLNRHGRYFLKLYQKRSYVIAYDNAPQVGCTAEDAGSGCYFRNYGDLLLIGGDHRTGRSGEGYAAA